MPSYVVTGAGRGMGVALVKNLASNPSNKVIGLVRDKKAAEDKLAAAGVTNVHLVVADIGNDAQLRQAAKDTKAILGGEGLDVLIQNAAYMSYWSGLKSLKDYEQDPDGMLEDTRKSFDINVMGIMKTMWAFMPLIREGKQKKVIAISSTMGSMDFVNGAKLWEGAPYATSKAALNLMMAKFQYAYQDQGILFTTICPGSVDTAEGVTYPEEELAKLPELFGKIQAFAPGASVLSPDDAATQVLKTVGDVSLEGGHGGAFIGPRGI